MKIKTLTIIALFMGIIISGCAPRYSCKGTVPGTKCASLNEIYTNQVLGVVDADETEKESSPEREYFRKEKLRMGIKAALMVSSSGKIEQQRGPDGEEIVRGTKRSEQMPILSPPEIVRIWIAPWVDEKEDLHMDSYIYTEIRRKKWILGERIPIRGTSHTSSRNIGQVIDALK